MYFYNLNWCLKLTTPVGVHPEKTGLLQSCLFLFTFSINLIVFYLAVLFLIKKENLQLTDVTDALESGTIIVHGLIKLTALYVQRSNVLDLLTRTKNMWKIEDADNAEAKETCFNTLKVLKNVFKIFSIVTITPIVLFTLKPMIQGGQAFTGYVPKSVPSYVLTLLHNYVFTFGTYFPAYGYDIFFSTTVILIQVQFKLLNYKIKEIFENKRVIQDEVVFNREIKKWVDHHNYLIEFIQLFNRTKSTSLLFYFGIVVSSMCVQMFVTTAQEDMASSLEHLSLTIGLAFSFIVNYCLPAQLLTNEVEKIPDNIWSTYWYNSCPSAQFALRMILMRSQETLSITAGGFIPINLQTCLASLKTIFSYYTFLQTVDANNK